ncbi:MAG: heavy metal-binding domain-containing protein [Pseudomonadota bacterium]
MIDVYIFLALILLGYFAGRTLERRHYRSIERREKELRSIPTTNGRRPLGDFDGPVKSELVHGACVVSVDYFKRIVAALRQLFGGNVRSYETLVDRARREAVLRLKESCPDAQQIVNLRLETSSITKGRAQQIGAVEVHAYATAIFADR